MNIIIRTMIKLKYRLIYKELFISLHIFLSCQIYTSRIYICARAYTHTHFCKVVNLDDNYSVLSSYVGTLKTVDLIARFYLCDRNYIIY